MYILDAGETAFDSDCRQLEMSVLQLRRSERVVFGSVLVRSWISLTRSVGETTVDMMG